ncbi:hypothetical protein ACHAQH_008984 [Verticillium albo-atrum]
MITVHASRNLLRELSSPARTSHIYASAARRAFTTTPNRRAQLQNPPTPHTPAPISQQQAERALLSKLSTLTPVQISTLLNTPPGTLPAAPSSQPAGIPPRQTRLRRWTPRLVFAFISLCLGYYTGEELIVASPTLTSLYGSDQTKWDVPDDPAGHGMTPQLLQTRNAISCQSEYPLAMPLFDRSLHDAEYKLDSRAGTILNCEAEGQFPLTWPAHAELQSHLRASHLVTGPLNDHNGLGFLHQVYRDPFTGSLSLFLMFGSATQSFPGIVHGGALATIMDEAMGRIAGMCFGGAGPVTANLDVRYAKPLAPFAPVVVRMLPMSEWAAARHETQVRRAKMVKPWEKDDGWEMVERPQEAAAETGAGLTEEAWREKMSRKVWVVARMELADTGELVCEATGLFVAPKGLDLKPMVGLW